MDRPRVEAFNERFRPDDGAAGPFPAWSGEDTLRLFAFEPALFTDFMNSQARSSYEQGLFRVLGPATDPNVCSWNGPDGWSMTWPQFARRLIVFGYDWAGRLYGIDKERVLRGEPLLARLDPGDGSLRQSDTSFAEFVLSDLVHYPDQLLGRNRFRAWLAAGGHPLGQREVVGYVAPLFDAGTDAYSNMAVTDVAAYVAKTGRAFAVRSGRSADHAGAKPSKLLALLRRS